MKHFLIAMAAMIGVSFSAQAATFYVDVNDEGETYVQMIGQTQRSDEYKLEIAVLEAQNTYYTVTADVVVDGVVTGTTETEIRREFSNDLYLEGPGGDMIAGINTAWMVREMGLNTIASNQCASACGLVFLGGVERELSDYGSIGFHMPYVMEAYALNDIKEQVGWLGVQDYMNSSSALFAAFMTYFGLDQDYLVFFEISQIEGTRELFWVDHNNFDLIGKYGRVN